MISQIFPCRKNDRRRSVFSRRKNGPAHPFHVEKLTREKLITTPGNKMRWGNKIGAYSSICKVLEFVDVSFVDTTSPLMPCIIKL